MTIDKLYNIYKGYRDYADGNPSLLPKDYILRDQKQRVYIQKLLQKDLDFDKFMRANVAMDKQFFIYMSNSDRAMTCYNEFEDYIQRNRGRFVKDLFEAYGGIPRPLSLEDRDTFVKVAAEVDYKIWALLLPDVGELLQSLNDQSFITRVYRFHLIVEKMQGYTKIRTKFREKILRG